MNNLGESRIDDGASVGALRESAQDQTPKARPGTIVVSRERPSEIPRSPSNQFRYVMGAFVAAVSLHLALMIAVNL